MKRIFILFIALSLYALACKKEVVRTETNVQTSGAEVAKRANIYRDSLARMVVQGLKDRTFSTAIQEGFSAMRDGDSEILLAEIAYPAHLRSYGWQRQALTAMTSLENENGYNSEEKALKQLFSEMLTIDPLVQLLFVAPDGAEPTEEQLASPDLHVAIWPKGVSDNAPIWMEAYSRTGEKKLLRSDEQPAFPVIVVGDNERLLVNPSNSENLTLYHSGKHDLYYKEGLMNIKANEQTIYWPSWPDDDWYLIYWEWMERQRSENKLQRADMRQGAEVLVKAGFKSQNDLIDYEPWGKGRPEMRVLVAGHDKLPDVDVRFDDRGWYYGNKKTLNNRFFPWCNLGRPGDFYTVAWVEEDGGSDTDLDISYMHQGIKVEVKFKIQDDDDKLGYKPVCYTDPLGNEGTRYDLGQFEFWVDSQWE